MDGGGGGGGATENTTKLGGSGFHLERQKEFLSKVDECRRAAVVKE